MNLDLSKFKKISDNEATAVLHHPDGHKIEIAKGVLKKKHAKDLSKLPLHFDVGGAVPGEGSDASEIVPTSNPAPEETQQLPNYTTNGNFDFNRFILDNPNAPLESKINVLKNRQATQENDAARAQAGSEKNQKNIEEYNRLASLQGLPPMQAPIQVASADRSAGMGGDGDLSPSSTLKMDETPKVAPAPQDPYGTQAYQDTYLGGVNQQQAGIQRQAQAEGALGKQQAQVYQNSINQKQQVANDFQSQLQKYNQEYDHFMNDYKNQHIDPKHYLNSMGTGQKISTAIGLILGGMGGGLTGQENPVMKFLNQQIENDINAQKSEMGKTENLLTANMHHLGDIRAATEMTRAMQMGIVADQLSQKAAETADPLAKARAMQASGALKQQAAPILSQLAMRKTLMNSMGQALQGDQGGTQNIDQTLNVLRMTNPEMAKNLESRYVPGVGVGSIPVPEKQREELITRESLNHSLTDLYQFADKHSGSLDPSVINAGKAKASLVQDLYRRANGQGVFREAEKEFVGSIIGEDPTKFFKTFRTQPRYKAAIEDNLMQLNGVKKSYGLPTRFVPKTATKYVSKN